MFIDRLSRTHFYSICPLQAINEKTLKESRDEIHAGWQDTGSLQPAPVHHPSTPYVLHPLQQVYGWLADFLLDGEFFEGWYLVFPLPPSIIFK